LNEVLSVATFLKIVNVPFLICMTGFQMTQVTFHTGSEKLSIQKKQTT